MLEIVLTIDYSSTTGDIVVGTMGDENQVIILKRSDLLMSN